MKSTMGKLAFSAAAYQSHATPFFQEFDVRGVRRFVSGNIRHDATIDSPRYGITRYLYMFLTFHTILLTHDAQHIYVSRLRDMAHATHAMLYDTIVFC